MKILVTGGAGFIGSNFIRHVLANRKEYSIVNYDKLTYAGNLANLSDVANLPDYTFLRGDICDTAALESAVRGCDAIVHFAAESHVDRSIYEPSPVIQTNITGTFAVLEIARKLAIKRVIHISTDEVYGDIPGNEYADEEWNINPSSPYSASKAAADLLARSYVRTYGLPIIITRSSNNYGPYQFPEKFLPLMIMNALAGKPLPVYGDGKNVRNWLHVEDNCRAVLAVLEKGNIGQIYNIAGPSTEDNLTVVREVLRSLGKPESLLSFVQDRPGHDRRYALTSKKLESELGWKPAVNLEDGLRMTIDWYVKNREWLEVVQRGEYLQYYEKYYENRADSLQAYAKPGMKAN